MKKRRQEFLDDTNNFLDDSTDFRLSIKKSSTPEPESELTPNRFSRKRKKDNSDLSADKLGSSKKKRCTDSIH